MKANSIFEYNGYKDYLRHILDERSLSRRGERSRLAQHMGCHSAYVSQVLNGASHLSLEQGERASHFLGLPKDQCAFFLLLIQYERAGTDSLRAVFWDQMKKAREQQFVLKDRLQAHRTLTREDQATFYSSWHYGAVHVLVSVPGGHREAGIAQYLGLPMQRVAEVLGFLVQVGLVNRDEHGYAIGQSHIHLEHDSPLITKHHTNWRLRAIQSFDDPREKDLHYSSVITCSRADADRLREVLVRAVEEIRSIVRPSANEDAFGYSIDFIELKR